MHESLEDRAQRLRGGFRAQALRDLLASWPDDDGAVGDDNSHVLAMLLVDATLEGDEVGLHEASRSLQVVYRKLMRSGDGGASAEARGRILAFLDVAAWAIERALSLDALAKFEGDAAAFDFLKAIHDEPGLANKDIAQVVDISEYEASRVGRRLSDAGLAAKRRVGRTNYWELTPKGVQSLDLLERGSSRHRRPNLQRT